MKTILSTRMFTEYTFRLWTEKAFSAHVQISEQNEVTDVAETITSRTWTFETQRYRSRGWKRTLESFDIFNNVNDIILGFYWAFK